MNEKLEESVHNIKTPGLNNPESYELTHNRFNIYMVLIFNNLNKGQNYKIPCRGSPQHKIEILKSFDFLKVFKPNKHTEDYHIRRPNDENFLFEIEDEKYIYVGEKVITFETNDITVEYSSKLDFNNVKYSYAYFEENFHFMFHQKYLPIQEYKNSSEKNEYQ